MSLPTNSSNVTTATPSTAGSNHDLEGGYSVADLLEGIADLHEVTRGEERVRIALLDGPVDSSHDCFGGARLTSPAGVQASSGAASAHGTHMASILFGQPGSSIAGVAPGCHGVLLPVFADSPEGKIQPCSQIELARNILLALNHHVDLISISAGQFSPSSEAHPVLAKAIAACEEAGVLVAAAAGNEGCQCLHVPGALKSVIAVGAMDSQGEPLGFSNWGEAYASHGVLAPGDDIPGALPGNRIAPQSGTSQATAITSGVIALLLSVQKRLHGQCDSEAVREAVLKTAVTCEQQKTEDCRRLLTGRLNPSAALNLILQTSHFTFQGERPMSNQHPSELAAVLPPSTHDPEAPAPAEAVSPAAHAGAPETDACVSPSSVGAEPISPMEPYLLPSQPQVSPSGCQCETAGGGSQQQAGGKQQTGNSRAPTTYALGILGTDFVSEARRDSIAQAMGGDPNDSAALLEYLDRNPWDAASLQWTLNLEAAPIYVVRGFGPYANVVYDRLREFLRAQVTEGSERVSVPGYAVGYASLMSGQTVPVLHADPRGMYSWSTQSLVEAVVGEDEQKAVELVNFLERIYFELQNLGATPQERAINFAATNAIQANHVFTEMMKEELKLDSIDVEPSSICRPESECWDVKLTFFSPTKRLEQARTVYRFTIDVSDVVPVTVGKMRRWQVY